MAYRLGYLGLWMIYLNERTLFTFTLYVYRLVEQSVCIIAESMSTHITSYLQPLYVQTFSENLQRS